MTFEGNRPVAAAQPEWLTLGQAAKYLGVAQSTMRKWSDLGAAGLYTPGGHRRYRRSDLDQFLDRAGPASRRSSARGPLVLSSTTMRACGSTFASISRPGASSSAKPVAPRRVAALGQESPDLILLDVMMPQVDGWETLRRIQEHTGVGAIPVIMFSGQVDERSAGDAESRGVQGFIGKPFDPRSLIESTKQQLPVV